MLTSTKFSPAFIVTNPVLPVYVSGRQPVSNLIPTTTVRICQPLDRARARIANTVIKTKFYARSNDSYNDKKPIASASVDNNPNLSARDIKSMDHSLWAEFPSARTTPPDLAAHHWINLTNGLELLPLFTSSSNVSMPSNVRFTRIQSSHCEAGAFDKLLWSLDNDLLLSLATGRPCYVYDLASRNKLRGVSRALFLGLQFVRWSLSYLWFGLDHAPPRVLVRGINVVPYWRDEVMPYRIEKDTKKRIRYYKQYAIELGVSDVRLYAVYGRPTDIDGCSKLHVKFLRQWLENLGEHRDLDMSTRSSDNRTDNENQETMLQHAGLVIYDPERTCDELREIQLEIKERIEKEEIEGG